MSDLSHLIPEGSTARSIFMPEQRCARCDEKAPEFSFVFNYRGTALPDETTELGFCSQDCYVAFCGGLEGARTMKL